MPSRMSAHSSSPRTVEMRATWPGAAMTVSVAPAARWRYESLPGMSMSKPWWEWCLMLPTSNPRAVSSAITRSISVVLPELCLPTNATAGETATFRRAPGIIDCAIPTPSHCVAPSTRQPCTRSIPSRSAAIPPRVGRTHALPAIIADSTKAGGIRNLPRPLAHGTAGSPRALWRAGAPTRQRALRRAAVKPPARVAFSLPPLRPFTPSSSSTMKGAARLAHGTETSETR